MMVGLNSLPHNQGGLAYPLALLLHFDRAVNISDVPVRVRPKCLGKGGSLWLRVGWWVGNDPPFFMFQYKNNSISAIQVSDLVKLFLNNREAVPEWVLNRHEFGQLRITQNGGVVSLVSRSKK